MRLSRWRWPAREEQARFWSDLQLAGRNLLRNRRRSVSTLLALAVGLVAILLFGGFKATIRNSMITIDVRAAGHLQIQHRDFFLYGVGNPTAYGIPRFRELVDVIRKDPELAPLLTVVTPRLQLGGVAGNFDAGVSTTVLGVAYDAEDVSHMRAWNEFSVPVPGKPYPLAGAAADGAVIGVGVARVLQLCERLQVPNCPAPPGGSPAAGPASLWATSARRRRRAAARAPALSCWPAVGAVRLTWRH
jgi:putative ABC transport system permease protein